jgi:glycerol-1-phosphate dehydrogenase [NAD(P)+]
MVAAPLVVDIGSGRLDALPGLLVDQRISSGGRVAIVVGATSGTAIKDRLEPAVPKADWYVAESSGVDASQALADTIRATSYDAVVGIGGGRVLDVAKFVAARTGLPMVSVATNLAHDGIASPVSILDSGHGSASFGVPAPVAVMVDLDEVRRAPALMVSAGVGDAISNLSAIADWQLAHREQAEPLDGLAMTLARTAAEAVLHHPGDLTGDSMLTSLAEALVLSGIAMAVAGSSRPCSGACHEISHAIDQLHPQRSGPHGVQVGVGAAFATYLRGDTALLAALLACLRRHGLPCTPAELGLTREEFVAAVEHAPQTRPGRFTILEHLAMDHAAVQEAVEGYEAAVHG